MGMSRCVNLRRGAVGGIRGAHPVGQHLAGKWQPFASYTLNPTAPQGSEGAA